jgi:hypothetical protein
MMLGDAAEVQERSVTARLHKDNTLLALFAWLISHQPAVLLSQNNPATSNQPALLFSQKKSALDISHQPNEQADSLAASASGGSYLTSKSWISKPTIKSTKLKAAHLTDLGPKNPRALTFF